MSCTHVVSCTHVCPMYARVYPCMNTGGGLVCHVCDGICVCVCRERGGLVSLFLCRVCVCVCVCTGTGGGLVSLFLGVSASIRGGQLHSFDVRDCRFRSFVSCLCVCMYSM